MKMILRYFLTVALLFTAAGGVSACSSTPAATTESAEVTAIRAYADPATRTTLEGLSENNLAKYTQNSNAQFKSALTQDILDKTAAQIKSQLGGFVSITFVKTEQEAPYTIVHYKAKYEKGEVGVRMVFDADKLIAGQWFE
jgi:hypothetical protein